MYTGSVAILGGVAGVVFCVGYVLTVAFDRYGAQVESRLQQLPTTGRRRFGRRASPAVRSPDSAAPHKWSQLANRLVPNQEKVRRNHQARLLQAGVYSPSALSTFFAFKLGLMMAPPLLGLLAVWTGVAGIEAGLILGCVAGGFGMILPSVWLERKVRQRHCYLRRSVPDFLDLTIVCLEGGLSLQGTIQRVTEELRIAHPILAGEMYIVQRDIDLGLKVESAFRRLAERTGYEGLRSLSTFIREAQRLGTELAEALRLHADMLRGQREQAAEEMAQKANVKILLPTLLLILPAVFVVLAGPAAIQIQQAFSK